MATGDDREGSEPPQHPLVEALVPDPSEPPDPSVAIVGLRGRSAAAGTLRLYVTATLDVYVEVPEGEVIHTRELPDDGGTQVWVRTSARVKHVRVESQQVQAEFLGGSIAEGYATGPAAGLAGSTPRGLRVGNRTHYCGGGPTTRCPSERRCPTDEWCFADPGGMGPADVAGTIGDTYYATCAVRRCPTAFCRTWNCGGGGGGGGGGGWGGCGGAYAASRMPAQ
ncbi:MAG TPA: hypothetical protein VM942_01435 [Acidimicrobiales bacterium]|nr:hypothetical protein [Acidimicrobiales bacterium]